MTVTEEQRFPVQSHPGDFERPWREVESEHDLHTATVWALHLRVESPEDVEPMAQALLRSGSEWLTGFYIGGDSFRQWAEPYVEGDPVDGNGVALHMYFSAPALPNARIRGGALAKIAYLNRFSSHTEAKRGIALLCCISTAADWSLQAEVII